MSKRKFQDQVFPDVLEKIKSGRYTVKAPTDTSKYSSKLTWGLMRLIFDDNNELLQDYYYCSKCTKIYNLKLSDNSKTLKRHAEKCNIMEQITDHFMPEMVQARKKIKLADKKLVKDAAMEYIIRDLRPISSINGDGLREFASRMTYIGVKYGYLTSEAIDEVKLLPSRQTVIDIFYLISEFFYLIQKINEIDLSISVYEPYRKNCDRITCRNQKSHCKFFQELRWCHCN